MSTLTQRLNAKNQAKGLNVVSLFDGMACAMLALQVAGVKVNKYYASEIEKHPIAVSTHNWGNQITHMGDITNWKSWNIDWSTIDLICGGSPCQGFSFAGARLEFNDPRSKLFFIYMDIYNHVKTLNSDVKFLLENVKMSQKSEDVISKFLNVAPVTINSAIVSAQNRVHLYWTNISFDRNIKDRHIYLVDILDDEINESDLHSENFIKFLNKVTADGRTRWDFGQHSDSKKNKSACLVSSMHNTHPNNVLIDRRKDVLVYQYPRGNNKGGIINTKGKSPTVTSSRWEQNCKVVIGAREVGRRLDENGKRDDKNPNIKPEQRFELREDQKSNCMTTVAKDSLLAILNNSDYIIRRFTVRECCALQTVPWQYLDGCIIGNRLVAKTHLYKMLGNGWTVEVIAIIFRGILNPSANDNHQPQRPQIQQDLFAEVMA